MTFLFLLNLGFSWGTGQPSGITMPALIGINFYEALELLQAAGIYQPAVAFSFNPSTITVNWQKSSQYRGGIVIAQLPAAGSGATAGEAVTLTLADYPFGSVIDMPPDWKQRLN